MDAQGNVLEVKPGIYNKGGKWTEFYYPSTLNPNWNDGMEDEWQLTLTEEGYMHEILAEFGQETVGVFNKLHVDRAQEDYQYCDKVDYPALRIVGVDWDKEICPYGVNCWKSLRAA